MGVRRIPPAARTAAVPVAVALAAGSLAAAGPAAARPIAVEPFASKLAADRGVLAWSHWDPAAAEFRLALRVHGRTVLPAIAPRRVPFDVSLGTDGRGRVVAVYSRCARDGAAAIWIPVLTGPTPSPPRGCRLAELDVASGRERRIAAVPATGSPHLPAIAGTEIAYVRTAASGRPELIAQTLPRAAPPAARRSPGRPVPAPARTVAVRLRGETATGSAPGPVALSLAAGGLAVDWLNRSASGWTYSVFVDRLPAGRRPAAQVGLVDGVSDRRIAAFTVGADLRGSAVFDGYAAAAPAPGIAGDAVERTGLDGATSTAAAPHVLRAAAVDAGTAYVLAGPLTASFADCRPAGCSLLALRAPAP